MSARTRAGRPKATSPEAPGAENHSQYATPVGQSAWTVLDLMAAERGQPTPPRPSLARAAEELLRDRDVAPLRLAFGWWAEALDLYRRCVADAEDASERRFALQELEELLDTLQADLADAERAAAWWSP